MLAQASTAMVGPYWFYILLAVGYWILEPGLFLAPWLVVLGMKNQRKLLIILGLIWYMLGICFVCFGLKVGPVVEIGQSGIFFHWAFK